MSLDFTPFQKLYGPTAAMGRVIADPADLATAFEQSDLLKAIDTIARFQGGHSVRSPQSFGNTSYERHEYTGRNSSLTFISHIHGPAPGATNPQHDVIIRQGGFVIFSGQCEGPVYRVTKIEPADLLGHKQDIHNLLRWQTPTTSSRPATP